MYTLGGQATNEQLVGGVPSPSIDAVIKSPALEPTMPPSRLAHQNLVLLDRPTSDGGLKLTVTSVLGAGSILLRVLREI
jgi:hypothetical protein